MAKTTLRTLFGATLLALATLVQAQEPRVVAITQIVEHPALDAVYQGIKDELAERGFKEGDNLEVMHESAQGNSVGIYFPYIRVSTHGHVQNIGQIPQKPFLDISSF